MNYLVELHALVDAHITVEQGHHLAHELQREIQQRIPEISHITIHVEPAP